MSAPYEPLPGELVLFCRAGLCLEPWADGQINLDCEVEELTALSPPESVASASQPSAQVLREVMAFEFSNKGGEYLPKPLSPHNIVVALKRCGIQPLFNEFTGKCELSATSADGRYRTEELNDRNETQTWLLFYKKFRFLTSRELLRAVILDEAHRRPIHPVRDYLNGLRWDGIPRIDRWLVTFAGAANTAFVRAVCAIFLIAAVRRIRRPGVKFDELTVLEGAQGLNKSSAVRALCPDPDWFTDSVQISATPKEIIEQTSGMWFVEFAELAGMPGTKIETMKAFLSRQKDSARLSYGHHRTDVLRQWVAIGTTNDSQYLRDDTGNRRFWPVAIQRFDLGQLEAARDQLWAEANIREASGESIRLPESLWADAASEQQQRHVEDPWKDELLSSSALNSATLPNSVASGRRVTRRELYAWLGLDSGRATKADGMRLASVMRQLGWRRMTVVNKATNKQEQGYGIDP